LDQIDYEMTNSIEKSNRPKRLPSSLIERNLKKTVG